MSRPADPSALVFTTSIGSLPRPPALLALLAARESGQPVDDSQFAETERAAVFEVAERQEKLGIDIPSSGEMGRPGFFHYIKDRFTGFAGPDSGWMARDLAAHLDLGGNLYAQTQVPMVHPACTGDVTVADPEAVHRDIDLFRQALRACGHAGAAVMTAPGPGVVVMNIQSLHYEDDATFMSAVGRALAHEYRATVEAGFILQVDCPDLFLARNVALPGSPYGAPRYRTPGQYFEHVDLSVATLTEALAGLPADRVRVHACNGNHPSTHEFDVHAGEILDRLLTLPVSALCLENANPQHALDHEPVFTMLAEGRWPSGRTVIPGIIDTKSPVLEPLELLDRRAGSWLQHATWHPLGLSADCGLSTYAGYPHLAPSVAWSKLRRLAEIGRAIKARSRPGG
ncbi:MAG TPA: hypothetical protein VKS82_13995 [Streptosporangiaceae bacterium]|jgi:5-methyltetrahydropteroyltriglutamate--homocysteine methyltransferase|nr:hypothetical protein [Streptosporangiaceae bacterium]